MNFSSIDGLCKIRLHPCGEIFELEFLKLLKNKKIQYVQASQFDPMEIQALNEDSFDLNNFSAIDIANDIESS